MAEPAGAAGSSVDLGVQTVETHVGAVRTELGARDRTQAVIIAFESGLARDRRS